jgi:hypothetical protein
VPRLPQDQEEAMTDQPEMEAAPLSDEEIGQLRGHDLMATLGTMSPDLLSIVLRLLATIDQLRAKVAECEGSPHSSDRAQSGHRSRTVVLLARFCALTDSPDVYQALNAVAALRTKVAELEAELFRVCGPICPTDGHRASEHVPFGQHHLVFKSWAPPSPMVRHSYEECSDCDALFSYHHDGILHCTYCDNGPDECDGTPLIGGVVPPHPKWPDGEAWFDAEIARRSKS